MRIKAVLIINVVLVLLVGFAWKVGDVWAGCVCTNWEVEWHTSPSGSLFSVSYCKAELCGTVCGPGTYGCNKGCCPVGNPNPTPAPPTEPPCEPGVWACSSCSVSCGGGTQWCGDNCSGYSQVCNTQSCCNPNLWGACSPAQGPGTQTNDCGTTRSCCTVSSPTAPSLTSPANGSKQASLTAGLSWSGVNFGYGCPSSNNQYRLYIEAGDSTPDTLVATLGSGTTSYNFTGQPDNRYYWQVVASNGSQTTASAVRSFYSPGLVTGTLFDASETDSCALMAGEPKISGGVVNITGPSSYTPTSDVLGIYSQYVLSPDNYTLSVSPGEGYLLPPKLTCQGFSANFTASGSTATRDFGFWRVYGGWFQAVGGDVYGGGGIENIIPATLPAEERYLIKEDVNGNGGLAYYRTGELELGGGSGVAVSQKGWQAESGYGGQDANYEYYTAKMRIFEKTDWDGEGKPVFAPKADDDWEVYTRTGNAYIDFDVVGLEKMIFMVDGDVTVTGDVLVEKGAHLTVIASGNITFEDDVSQAQGWWVADRIVIESTGDEATEIQFRGEGSFVGYDAIEFNRDRGITNNSEPAEIFTYRPDMMTNAPGAIKLPRFHWSEQVP